MSAPADTGIPGRGIVSSVTSRHLPRSYDPNHSGTPSGTVFLRQFADHGRVGAVDRLDQLVVRDRAADPQRVPPGAADVGHDGRVLRVPQQPLVGCLPAGSALQAYGRCVTRSEEREDLAADLGHHVAFPRLVLPGPRLGQAVGEQSSPCHDRTLTLADRRIHRERSGDGGCMSGSGPVGFDLDMTLINSRPAILASFAETSRETGTAIDLDAVDRRLGVKLDDELAFWLPPDRVAAAAEIYRRHYLRLAEPMTTVLPGAHEALAAVRAAGQRAVIITAKHPVSARPSLQAAGLAPDELFTLVHGPEKAAVLRRLKAVAYVGDTPPDMAAAVQAGARAVGVATGSFTADDLAGAGAEVVLDSLAAFPDWYRSA